MRLSNAIKSTWRNGRDPHGLRGEPLKAFARRNTGSKMEIGKRTLGEICTGWLRNKGARS